MRTNLYYLLGLAILIITSAACSPDQTFRPTLAESSTARVIEATPSATHTPAASRTFTPAWTRTPTATMTITPTMTETPIPTVESIRVKVVPDQVVCHYGPGKPYLYKYALIGGSNLEAIARVQYGDFLEVRAIGGSNPCWVNPEWLQINGDVRALTAVAADEAVLPLSPYYGPVSGVTASRAGNEVTLQWNPVTLRAGDDSEQVPYLVEAWVCQAGVYKFSPVGAYQTSITLSDESGCELPSKARVLAAEKHGYTLPVEVDWPIAEQP